ncbi:MAG: type II toxin-antitoxin system RelE/ParE family toxin [Candidatus Thiodiazotropha sp.]
MSDYLIEQDAVNAIGRIDELVDALSVLETNPMIGWPTLHGLRELVIGRASSGHVALYQFVVEIDTVFVLAIRGQKETGYG